jgi:hypothetical protein
VETSIDDGGGGSGGDNDDNKVSRLIFLPSRKQH